MSCSSNKTTATTNFNAATFLSVSQNITMYDETYTSGNSARLAATRGKIRLDLSAYTSGSCTVYFKVTAKTDGSDNSPPVTADGLYHSALSATMGQVNTSDYYANTTPTFHASNNCGAAVTVYGWTLTDQIAAIQPTFTYNV